MMYVVRLPLLILLMLSQAAFAVKMDETTHDQIIKRFEMGLTGMDKDDSERTGIMLRLADLYSDRSRLKAMNEIEENCSTCKGAREDRQRALNLYIEALPKIEKSDQGRRIVQMAHIYGLNDQSSKATELYEQLARSKRGAYTSEIRAIALSSLAEQKFRAGDFKTALKDFEAAKREQLKTKGFVEYRIAWCQLNLGQTEKSTNTLVKLLQSPQLLATQTTDGTNVDSTFVNEVSRDYATFLARGRNVGHRQIRSLLSLSPNTERKGNLRILATETDRLGKKSASLLAWSFYIEEGDVLPAEKLDVQTRAAQIYYDINQQNQAAAAYEKALIFWNTINCKNDDAKCEEARTGLRRFVTTWNKAQKRNPTDNLLRIYMAYTKTFPNDTEMLQWGAVVAQELKRYDVAASLFHQAAVRANIDLQSTPENKTIRNIFEGSLLAEIEMAELTKSPKARESAYNFYLQINPNGSKAFEVRYQRAQLYNEMGRLLDAYSEFHYLAVMQIKDNRDFRVKSADLALDSLAGLKDDKTIEVRSLEYARIFPERKSEYLKISRNATMNLVAADLKNEKSNSRSDYKESLAALSAVSMVGASDGEKIKFYKNKILIAQKAMDLDAVASTAAALLSVNSLNADDKEWAMSQQVWVAELALNFDLAYRISANMKSSNLSKADRELRLALLAELAGRNSYKHNEAYIKYSSSVRSSNLVRITMIRNARAQWKELERHQTQLNKTPDLLAGIALEVYTAQPNRTKAIQLLKTTKISRYAAGKTIQRNLDLKDYYAFDSQIRRHKIYGYSDSAVQKTLKQRIKLLDQAESKVHAAFRSNDFTMQALGLAQLARENRRMYDDIQDLPIPKRLNNDQRKEYTKLLNAQSDPYRVRAAKLESELNDLWNKSGSVQNLQSAYMNASPDLQKLYRAEITPLAVNAPSGVRNRLENLLNTPLRRPSQKDIMYARKELQANPFNISKAEKLRDLENQNGQYSMVAYLDERISQLKKGNSL